MGHVPLRFPASRRRPPPADPGVPLRSGPRPSHAFRPRPWPRPSLGSGCGPGHGPGPQFRPRSGRIQGSRLPSGHGLRCRHAATLPRTCQGCLGTCAGRETRTGLSGDVAHTRVAPGAGERLPDAARRGRGYRWMQRKAEEEPIASSGRRLRPHGDRELRAIFADGTRTQRASLGHAQQGHDVSDTT